MCHALHLPFGERVGHGEADIDVTAFVSAQLRVEEGGLVEVGADLLGGGIGCATCGFLSGCHRRRSSLIVRCSNILNHIENYLSLFTSFKINTIVIASYPHTIHYRLGTIATVAAHGHHLSIVARAATRVKQEPISGHADRIIQGDIPIVMFAKGSSEIQFTETAIGIVPRSIKSQGMVVVASQCIQRHIVHRAQEFGGNRLPVFVGEANLILLRTAWQRLVAETQEFEMDVFHLVGDRD